MRRALFPLFIACALCSSAGAATYDIHVAGVQVTDANKNDVLGNGKVRFDPNSKTMTISWLQASIEDTFLVVGAEYKQSFQLVCYQNNTITSNSGYSIVYRSPYTMTITGNLQTDGILIYSQLHLIDASIQAFGTDKSGQTTGIVSVDETRLPLMVNHSNITQSYISGFGWINYTNCELLTPDVTYNNTTMCFEDAQGNRMDKVDIRSYERYANIGGVPITSNNYENPLGDGTIKYDPTNRFFILNDLYAPNDQISNSEATVSTPGYVTYTIDLHGQNTLFGCCFFANATESIQFQGDGMLHIVSEDAWVGYIGVGRNVSITNGCKIYVDGKLGAYGYGGILTVNHSTLIINQFRNLSLLSGFTQVNLIGSKIVYPEGAVWDSNLKAFTLNGVEVTDRIEIAPINTPIAEVKEDIPTGPAYDLLGRPVNDTYHGIVIRDGKKYVQ